MTRFAVAFLSVCALAPAAFGQIIYEPVRYQYRTPSGGTYYYGGSEPRTFYWAAVQDELDSQGYNRYRYGSFSGGDRFGLGDGYVSEKPRVYNDYLPYRNARRYGFTADDARNEALRSAPLYFRKVDLLRAAEVQPDGTMLVPSHPRMVVVVDRNVRRDNGPATRPATTGKIIIIPKSKPANTTTSDKPVVASR
jgi:hypothetical protein